MSNRKFYWRINDEGEVRVENWINDPRIMSRVWHGPFDTAPLAMQDAVQVISGGVLTIEAPTDLGPVTQEIAAIIGDVQSLTPHALVGRLEFIQRELTTLSSRQMVGYNYLNSIVANTQDDDIPF